MLTNDQSIHVVCLIGYRLALPMKVRHRSLQIPEIRRRCFKSGICKPVDIYELETSIKFRIFESEICTEATIC